MSDPTFSDIAVKNKMASCVKNYMYVSRFYIYLFILNRLKALQFVPTGPPRMVKY